MKNFFKKIMLSFLLFGSIYIFSFIFVGNINTYAITETNPYTTLLTTKTKDKIDTLITLVKGKKIMNSNTVFNNWIIKISNKIKELKDVYKKNTKILIILGYLDYEIDEIIGSLDSLSTDDENFIDDIKSNKSLSGCDKIETFFAREPYSLKLIPGSNRTTTRVNGRITQSYNISNPTILKVCSQNSVLNSVSNSGLYEFDEIMNACEEGYHPMEKWELDALQGTEYYELGESLTPENEKIRFTFYDGRLKSGVTHWLFDNYYDNEEFYGYIQGSKNMTSIGIYGVKIRCVQNNGIARSGKTKIEIAGCDKIIKKSNGLEICASNTLLLEDYKNPSLGSRYGLPLESSYSTTPSYMRSLDGLVVFPGKYICPEGYDFPDNPFYYEDLREVGKGSVSFSDKNSTVYRIALLKKGYVIFSGDKYFTFNDLSEIRSLDRDLYNLLSPYLSELEETDFVSTGGSYKGPNKKISGVCIKQNDANTDYLLEMTGCSDTIKVGNIEFCSEPSKTNSCLDGYHEFTVDEYRDNLSELFLQSTSGTSGETITFPFIHNEYSTYTNLGKYNFTKPAYYLDGLGEDDYKLNDKNDENGNNIGYSYRNNYQHVTKTVNTNYNKTKKYFHFYGSKENGVETICVKGGSTTTTQNKLIWLDGKIVGSGGNELYGKKSTNFISRVPKIESKSAETYVKHKKKVCVESEKGFYWYDSDSIRNDLIEQCSSFTSDRQNGGLSCNERVGGCCPDGKVAINGNCISPAGKGAYCYATSGCIDGLRCSSHKCIERSLSSTTSSSTTSSSSSSPSSSGGSTIIINPSVGLSISKTSINVGESITLSWNSSLTKNCSLHIRETLSNSLITTNTDNNFSGNFSYEPSVTTDYTMYCGGLNTTSLQVHSDTKRVTVNN